MHPWPQGVRLKHFRSSEVERLGTDPGDMDPDLLLYWDELRDRCGFPIGLTSAGRTEEDLIRIYGSLEEAPNSPHQRRDDGLFHALDGQPHGVSDPLEFNRRLIEMFVTAFEMGPYREGIWERQGLELGTSHVHGDTDPVLRRPHYWGAASR